MKIVGQLKDSSSSNGRIDALDGLRAIAILLVLLWHFTPGHNSNQGLRSIIFKIADIGWSGVDLFFVLSGFLITGILLRAKASNTPFSYFLMRRILRILPAYYLALCIIFLFLPVASHLYPVPALSEQAPYWLYMANIAWALHAPDLGGVDLGHFWSLAVEMQFYILWPLVIYQFTPDTIRKVGLAALVFAAIGRIGAVVLDVNPFATFALLPFRMDGLIVGSLIAVALHVGVRYAQVRLALIITLVGGSIFAALITWFDMANSPLFRPREAPLTLLLLRVILPSALSLLYGAVLWISLQRNLLSALLGSSVLKPLALYSYGIYIIHFIFRPFFEQSFGPRILVHWTGGQDTSVYLFFVLASGISFILAMVSYHLVEVNFLRLKPSFHASIKPLATTIPETPAVRRLA
jgi:peptidoglycan/LPS O-acetylase OafA/YrhL